MEIQAQIRELKLHAKTLYPQDGTLPKDLSNFIDELIRLESRGQESNKVAISDIAKGFYARCLVLASQDIQVQLNAFNKALVLRNAYCEILGTRKKVDPSVKEGTSELLQTYVPYLADMGMELTFDYESLNSNVSESDLTSGLSDDTPSTDEDREEICRIESTRVIDYDKYISFLQKIIPVSMSIPESVPREILMHKLLLEDSFCNDLPIDGVEPDFEQMNQLKWCWTELGMPPHGEG